MSYFRESKIQEIVNTQLRDPKSVLHGWIVTIDKRILTKGAAGQFIFPSRKNAVAALHRELYYSTVWRGQIDMYPPNIGSMSYLEHQKYSGDLWREWKKYMGDRIQIKQI